MINKNDEFEIYISDLSDDGAGIGHKDGFTWFVKDAVIGDTVLAGATKLKKSYGFARLIKVIEPSEHRCLPACPIARSCGGCQLQQLEYGSQLHFKEQKVRSDLIRIGGFAEEEIDAIFHPVIGMDDPLRYRNKAVYPIRYAKDGHICAGFFAGRTHNVIECEDCLLGFAENKDILSVIIGFMEKYGIRPYDEGSNSGTVRHVLIRRGYFTDELMICIVINAEKLKNSDILCSLLKEHFENLKSFSLCVNRERTNVIMGNKLINIYGPGYIEDVIHEPASEDAVAKLWSDDMLQATEDTLESKHVSDDIGHSTIPYGAADKDRRRGSNAVEATPNDKIAHEAASDSDTESSRNGVRFRISPFSFFQVNSVQTEKLYGTALKYAGLTGNENVWDLYCGVGTISLFLARHARKVYGVEIVPEAIENARENAGLNGLKNAEFFVGKAEEVLPEWYAKNYRENKISLSAERSESDDNQKRTDGGAETKRKLNQLPESDVLNDSEAAQTHAQTEQPQTMAAETLICSDGIDVIVVDPPRKGCDMNCLETMVRIAPKRIVYVSCDPATLSRDLKYLCQNGYKLEQVQPVDMFPQTVHVETVCKLALRNPVTHVNIDVDVEELVQNQRGQATYEQIKSYVLEHFGLKVSNLYIEQIKQKYGIIERENYNMPKSEDARVPNCPPEKEQAITEALKHFEMIPE